MRCAAACRDCAGDGMGWGRDIGRERIEVDDDGGHEIEDLSHVIEDCDHACAWFQSLDRGLRPWWWMVSVLGSRTATMVVDGFSPWIEDCSPWIEDCDHGGGWFQ